MTTWTSHSPGTPLSSNVAAIGELDPRADDEILHGARDENLVCLRQGRDPRAEMHGKPLDAGLRELELAGVQAGP